MVTLSIPNLLSSSAFACDKPQSQPGIDKLNRDFDAAMGKAKDLCNKLDGPQRENCFRMIHEADAEFSVLDRYATTLNTTAKDYSKVAKEIIHELNSLPQLFPVNRDQAKSSSSNMAKTITSAKPSFNTPSEKPSSAPLNDRIGSGVCYRDLRSLCHVSPAWVEGAVKRDDGKYCHEKEEAPSSTAKQTQQLYHCLQGRSHELPKETRQEFRQQLGSARDFQCDNLSRIAESYNTAPIKKMQMEAISKETRWELVRLEGQYFREPAVGRCEKTHVQHMGSNAGANPNPPSPPKTEKESPFMKGVKEVIKDAIQMGAPY